MFAFEFWANMQLVVKECKQGEQSVTEKHRKTELYCKTLKDTGAQSQLNVSLIMTSMIWVYFTLLGEIIVSPSLCPIYFGHFLIRAPICF